MTPRLIRTATAAFVLVGASVLPARAEIVFLTSGRVMSVAGHRFEDARIILQLRGGGEIACDRALVDRIEPDEVPYPDPADETATPAVDALVAVPYGEIIDAMSVAHGVDPRLVRAVIQVESAYRADARSSKGAMGLMQLMPATARQYAVANPYDPQSNLEAGIKHLRSLLSQFDRSRALAAYNAGEAAVRRFGGIPPYRETRDYVARVLRLAGAAHQ